jgi:hypothetical protein
VATRLARLLQVPGVTAASLVVAAVVVADRRTVPLAVLAVTAAE